MWQLFWYTYSSNAMMCYWQNNSKSIALSVWDTTPADKIGYGEAVRWNGLVGAFGFVVTFR
jgi:maltose/moltooligosaccharide transporter